VAEFSVLISIFSSLDENSLLACESTLKDDDNSTVFEAVFDKESDENMHEKILQFSHFEVLLFEVINLFVF